MHICIFTHEDSSRAGDVRRSFVRVFLPSYLLEGLVPLTGGILRFQFFLIRFACLVADIVDPVTSVRRGFKHRWSYRGRVLLRDWIPGFTFLFFAYQILIFTGRFAKTHGADLPHSARTIYFRNDHERWIEPSLAFSPRIFLSNVSSRWGRGQPEKFQPSDLL